MGTEYIILKDSEGFEVFLSEMSNKLDFCIFNKETEEMLSTEAITPEEMLKAFMKGIKVISYYMTKEDFDKVFSKLETFAF